MSTAPPGGNPQKGKAPATTLRAFQDSRTPGDFKPADELVQAGKDPFAKTKAIWAACITPTGRKLVLLALANYSNADGTGIRPAVATIAARCNVSPKQARRHIHDLQEMGVIRVTRPAVQHRPAEYALDFDVLLDLPQEGGLKPSSTPLHDPQTSHAWPSDLPPAGAYPFKDPVKDPPPGGGVASGPGFAGPEGLDSALWNRWVKKSRPDPEGLQDLVARGNELHAQGADLNALVDQALNANWRHWPRVDAAPKLRASQLGAATDWGMPA